MFEKFRLRNITLKMSKSTRTGGKQQSQVQYAQASQESSKMAENESVSAQLTIESLVKELERFRKDMTGEFVALLNSSLEPIRSSIESIGTTLTTQAVTISEMESGLSDHSDRIAQLEHDVSAVQSKLTTMEKENTALKASVEDLISRSKRHNIRVVGLPEGLEGKNAREFMTNLLSELLGDSLTEPPELDRAHRSLRPRPHAEESPRPLIIRFHRYIVKETVMSWAKSHKDMSYKGHKIKIYEDFSTEVAKKRAAFNKVKSLLYQKGVRFGMLYPARLRVSRNGVERIFDSPEAAETFYHQNFPN